MGDAFGQALLDHYLGRREQPLLQRDGTHTLVHRIDEYYFRDFEQVPDPEWLEGWLTGPLLDMGAGAGRDSLHFQNRFETMALEISESLVTLLRNRGVKEVCHGDMFNLTDHFERRRFRSALGVGIQVGQSRSMEGLRVFLEDLAAVTTADATAVVDGYDPNREGADEMLGYREDATPGLAFRVLHYQYGDIVGKNRLFRLFSPERFREATTGTDWTVVDLRYPHDTYHYRIALEKG